MRHNNLTNIAINFITAKRLLKYFKFSDLGL